MSRFKKLWIAPGLAVPSADESGVTLTLLLRRTTERASEDGEGAAECKSHAHDAMRLQPLLGSGSLTLPH